MLTLKVVEAGALPPLDPAAPGVREWLDPDGRVSAYSCRAGAHHFMELPSLARFRFGTPDEVLALVRPGANRDHVEDTFRRHVLPLALSALGYSVLHASAVVSRAGVVALCAAARTGKSTFAHALALRGYRPWADDAVAFQPGGGARLESLALPFHIRLRHEAAAFFAVTRQRPADDATSLDLAQLPRQPLAAVVVLKRTPGAECPDAGVVRRLRGSEALRALLPHAYCLDPEDGDESRRTFEHYMRLAADVQIHEFGFRPGLRHMNAAVDALVALAGDSRV